jgi:hypothetical protein
MSRNDLAIDAPEESVGVALTEEAGGAVSPATLRWLCLGLVALGAMWRIVRYGLRFPIWGDEAFVCVNFLDQDYAALMGPLKCAQVAPLLFLWGEQAAYQFLGGSELAVRLLPFLAGLASLALLWRLAWRTLPPLAAAFAVSLLATAYWPVAMSGTVKPYASDLFMALALLVPAVEYLYQPGRWGWLALLSVLCPLAIFSSYPAVFVAGAVSVAILPAVWRQSGWIGRSFYVLFNVGMVAAFLIHFGMVALNQLDRESGSVNAYLQEYWSDGYPPANPWEFASWLILIQTGRMSAYPVGDANGGSALTVLLILAGLVQLVRHPRGRGLWVLLLLPFALNLLAAVVHKYPYGGCCRLSQHLAPATCLLAGMGLAWVVQLGRSAQAQRRSIFVISALLAVVPIVGTARDLCRPYKDFDPYRARGVVRELFAHVKPNQPVVVMNAATEIDPVSRWLLAPYGDRIHLNGQLDPAQLEASSQVWILRLRHREIPDPATMCVNRTGSLPSDPNGPAPVTEANRLGQSTVMCCDIYRWRHVNGNWYEVPRIDLSYWPRGR